MDNSQNMEGTTIDPGKQPFFCKESRNFGSEILHENQSNAYRLHEVRKEGISSLQENIIPLAHPHPSSPTDSPPHESPPPTCSLPPRGPLNDITNSGVGSPTAGPKQKSWKKVNKKFDVVSDGPTSFLPKKKGSSEDYVCM